MKINLKIFETIAQKLNEEIDLKKNSLFCPYSLALSIEDLLKSLTWYLERFLESYQAVKVTGILIDYIKNKQIFRKNCFTSPLGL